MRPKTLLTVLSLILFISSSVTTAQTIDNKKIWLEKLEESRKMIEYQQFISVLPTVEELFNTKGKYFKESDLEYLDALHFYAISLYATGKIKKSEPLLKLDLELTEKYKGKDHKDYGQRANNYGLLLTSLGSYQEAIEILNEALTNYEKNHGTENKDYATALNTLGSVYVKLRNHDKAFIFLNEGLEIMEKVAGKNSLEYLTLSTNIAVMYMQIQKFKEALPLLLQNRKTVKSLNGKKSANYILVSLNIGFAYLQLENYVNAIEVTEECLRLMEQLNLQITQYYSYGLTNMSNSYLKLGDSEKAIDLLLQSKQIFENTSGKESIDYVIILASLGLNYANIGDFKNALAYNLQSKTILEEKLGTENELYSTLVSNLTMAFTKLGRYDEALKISLKNVERIESLFGIYNDLYCIAKNNLGQVYFELGDYNKALLETEEALKIHDSINKNKSLKKIGYKNNLASIYGQDNKYNKSKQLLLESRAIIDSLNLEKSIISFLNYNSLGVIENHQNNFKEGIKYLKKANKIVNEIVIDDGSKRLVKNNYGFALLENNQVSEGIDLFNEAIIISKINLKDIFNYSTELEKKNYLSTMKFDLDAYSSYGLVKHPEVRKRLVAINLNNELILKGVLLNSSKNILSELSALKDSTVNQKILEYRAIKAQISKLYASNENIGKDSINSLKDLKEENESYLVKAYSETVGNVYEVNKNWEAIRDNLSKDEIAIEFAHFNYRSEIEFTNRVKYVAYIIKSNSKTPKLVNLFEEKELEALLKNKSPDELYNSVALYDLVWQPLEKLTRKYDKIYYAPSGILNQIQLSAIRSKKGALIENKNLVRLSSTYNVEKGFVEPKLDDVYLFGGITYSNEKEYKQKEVDSLEYFLNSKESAMAVRGTKKRGDS